MKPYFAKYLPVESEIKEGDIVLDAEGAYGIVENIDRPLGFVKVRYEKSFYADNLKDNLKKVKLFLCSRDIQVGDKVYGREEDVVDTAFGPAFNREDALEIVDTDMHFKVIGEISPEATWVKEDDEFEEDEIDEWYWHLKQDCFAISVKVSKEIFNKSTNGMEFPFDNTEVFKRGFFKVKGPCGHFH